MTRCVILAMCLLSSSAAAAGADDAWAAYRFTVDHEGGPNAVVSGVFLDPAE